MKPSINETNASEKHESSAVLMKTGFFSCVEESRTFRHLMNTEQISKTEVSKEAVSPSILLSLYSSKCSYKKEDAKTTKYEVWQYFEILHKMIRVRIDHCKTEMMI